MRTELSHNNESYVALDMKGISLQQHYDTIKVMVKQKTGRAMQEKIMVGTSEMERGKRKSEKANWGFVG